VLEACRGKGFVGLRDEALIRLYANTGARLSEVGNLLVADLDMSTESVHFHGKGAKDRRVRGLIATHHQPETGLAQPLSIDRGFDIRGFTPARGACRARQGHWRSIGVGVKKDDEAAGVAGGHRCQG
jgi:integrase